MTTKRSYCVRTLALALSLLSLPAVAAEPAHWVGTWAAAPVATPNNDKAFAQQTTLRETVHVSLGGSSFRVVLSNELGTDPLILSGAAATVGSQRASLSFGGKPAVMIPAGAELVSDPIALKLPPLCDLTITLLVPAQTVHVLTRHTSAMATNYEAAGDQLNVVQLDAPKPIFSWLFLKAVEVEAAADAGSIVAFGDSITDGALSTANANARWPDVLARRLQANPATVNVGVLNEGIGGNRILHDGYGPNALARFDRDVLAQSGVRAVIVLEGINDIGHTGDAPGPEDVTAADLIAGLQQLITRAHAHGLRIVGATLTPYQGAKYATAKGEAIREAVNAFIRTPGNFDGVVDFDKATADPAHPLAFLPAYDSGDHLHPRDAGYKAMGESIDLSLFTTTK